MKTGRKPSANRSPAAKRHAAAERARYQSLSPAAKRDIVKNRDREAQRQADARRYERDRDKRIEGQKEINRKTWERDAPKRKARAAAALLPKPTSCSKCGARGGRIERHHPDHSQPTKTIPLCPTCHGKTQRKENS